MHQSSLAICGDSLDTMPNPALSPDNTHQPPFPAGSKPPSPSMIQLPHGIAISVSVAAQSRARLRLASQSCLIQGARIVSISHEAQGVLPSSPNKRPGRRSYNNNTGKPLWHFATVERKGPYRYESRLPDPNVASTPVETPKRWGLASSPESSLTNPPSIDLCIRQHAQQYGIFDYCAAVRIIQDCAQLPLHIKVLRHIQIAQRL